jgi:hypothetical protein
LFFEYEKPLKLSVDKLPFHQRWDVLVVEYTDRKLTSWTDRLPANSGIAQVMQKSTIQSTGLDFGAKRFLVVYYGELLTAIKILMLPDVRVSASDPITRLLGLGHLSQPVCFFLQSIQKWFQIRHPKSNADMRLPINLAIYNQGNK